MLRNRSRAVTSKQALMADQTPNPVMLSPTTKPTSPISSFLNSPRFLFWKKNQFSDTFETNNNINTVMIMSPTSILDTKSNNTSSNNSFVNPFGYDNYILSPNTKQETNKGIGLALIDSIIVDEKSENSGKFSKPINRTALFGSKLKVQIPVTVSPFSSNEESPKSPADFGIKTKNSQISSPPSKDSYFTRQLSLKEMELSEDYTCVITHGPNPKTTHIFDDCIVESCLGDGNGSKGKKMEYGFENSVPAMDFLSFCHTCKDVLGQGKDIYIYRGEKAFCSHECRSEEIYYDGMKNPGSNE